MLYVSSLLIPLFGIVLGAIYVSKSDEEHEHVGIRCMILGAVAMALMPTLLAAILYYMVLDM